MCSLETRQSFLSDLLVFAAGGQHKASSTFHGADGKLMKLPSICPPLRFSFDEVSERWRRPGEPKAGDQALVSWLPAGLVPSSVPWSRASQAGLTLVGPLILCLFALLSHCLRTESVTVLSASLNDKSFITGNV